MEKQSEYGYAMVQMEVRPAHRHLVRDVDSHVGIASVVAKIKGCSSHKLRAQYPWLKTRLPTLWMRAKFISPVGAMALDAVQRYIAGQKGV